MELVITVCCYWKTERFIWNLKKVLGLEIINVLRCNSPGGLLQNHRGLGVGNVLFFDFVIVLYICQKTICNIFHRSQNRYYYYYDYYELANVLYMCSRWSVPPLYGFLCFIRALWFVCIFWWARTTTCLFFISFCRLLRQYLLLVRSLRCDKPQTWSQSQVERE